MFKLLVALAIVLSITRAGHIPLHYSWAYYPQAPALAPQSLVLQPDEAAPEYENPNLQYPQGDDNGDEGDYAEAEDYSEPEYDYAYAASDPLTGDDKSQYESREGDVVHGDYSLAQPDGSVRVVEYTADDINGFNAIVKISEPLHHDQPEYDDDTAYYY